MTRQSADHQQRNYFGTNLMKHVVEAVNGMDTHQESGMSNGHQLLRAFRAIGLIVMVGVSINAYADLFGIGGTSWKEEVLLHDEQKIIVERTLERGGRHEIGQRSGVTNESLSFRMPGTNQSITWDDKYSEDIGSSNFNLLMLEIFKGTAYLVASPINCPSYSKWGRPNPPYVVFKHQDQDWVRIPIQELPIELVRPNLVISSPDRAAESVRGGAVSAETIKKLNGTAKQLEYITIQREPLTSEWCRQPTSFKAPIPIPSRNDSEKTK